MVITRPYGAEDNQINSEMKVFIEGYARRHDLVIDSMEIYGECVKIITEEGRMFVVSHANGCRARSYNQRNFWYLSEKVDGKMKRIKKSEW